MRKNYSEEQKMEILSRYRSGETLSSICKNTGISKSTLYQWKKTYNLKKRKELNLTDVRILKQRCEKYEKMVEILQMSPFIENSRFVLSEFLVFITDFSTFSAVRFD